MSVQTQFTCDGCGKSKGEVNHWWQVDTARGAILVKPMGVHVGIAEAHPSPVWCGGADTKHFCGQDCALKFISAQMAGGKG